jgi:hypothetical protein
MPSTPDGAKGDEDSTSAGQIASNCVRQAVFWPLAKAPDKCQGPGAEQALALHRCSRGCSGVAHLPTMVDSTVMTAGVVVKAFSSGSSGSKGVG